MPVIVVTLLVVEGDQAVDGSMRLKRQSVTMTTTTTSLTFRSEGMSKLVEVLDRT